MVDHARLTLGSRRLAIHSGSRRPSRQNPRLSLSRFAAPRAFGAGSRRKELARIDGALAATQLEMELRLAEPAGRADLRDDLSPPDLVAALHQQILARSEE